MYKISIHKLEKDFLQLVKTIGNNPVKEDFIKILDGIIDENIEAKHFTSEGLKDTFAYVVGEPQNITRMFTAHYDTVGNNVVRTEKFATNPYGHAVSVIEGVKSDNYYISSTDNEILGADDRAGCLVLANLIKAEIEGLYIFFPNEETGANASRTLSLKYDEIIKPTYPNIKYAIAFDRKGYGDIINQQGKKCCSDEFVSALTIRLAEYDLFYQGTTGVFTDTANLVYNIPECTNLSVGYFNHHQPTEWLNLRFVHKLISVICQDEFWKFDLPAVRPLSKRIEYNNSSTRNSMFSNYRYNNTTHAWETTNDEQLLLNRAIDVINRNNANKGLTQDVESADDTDDFIEYIEGRRTPRYTKISRNITLGTIYTSSPTGKLIMRTYPYKFSMHRSAFIEVIALNQAELRYIVQVMMANKKKQYDDSLLPFSSLVTYVSQNKIQAKLVFKHELNKSDLDNEFVEDIFSNIFI